jgi:hypothetical protein
MTTIESVLPEQQVPAPSRPRLRDLRPGLGPIASATLRSSVLIGIAMLLILVLLPVALGAAWTQVAIAP